MYKRWWIVLALVVSCGVETDVEPSAIDVYLTDEAEGWCTDWPGGIRAENPPIDDENPPIDDNQSQRLLK